MKRGRISKEEQARRFMLLLKFIFTFRYATRKQLEVFSKLIIGLNNPQWLIDYSLKQGLVINYEEPLSRRNIYHLTRRGKRLLKKEEPMVKYYHFEKRHAGMNTFNHHNLLVETFFLLQRQLTIKEWICEWVLRIDKPRKDKIPDGLMILTDDTRIAIEAETSYKTKEALRTVVSLYCYDIEERFQYNAVIVIAQDILTYESIKDKLYDIDPEFSVYTFILTEINLLKQGLCFYRTKIMVLTEAIKLLPKREVSYAEEI